jgi:hypothetical protein
MGKVVLLREFVPPLPTELPPRPEKKQQWLSLIRPILVGFFHNPDEFPEFNALRDSVDSGTAVYGTVQFDQKAMVDRVVEALEENTSTKVPKHQYARISKAITQWQNKESGAGPRRARLIATRANQAANKPARSKIDDASAA